MQFEYRVGADSRNLSGASPQVDNEPYRCVYRTDRCGDCVPRRSRGGLYKKSPRQSDIKTRPEQDLHATVAARSTCAAVRPVFAANLKLKERNVPRESRFSSHLAISRESRFDRRRLALSTSKRCRARLPRKVAAEGDSRLFFSFFLFLLSLPPRCMVGARGNFERDFPENRKRIRGSRRARSSDRDRFARSETSRGDKATRKLERGEEIIR